MSKKSFIKPPVVEVLFGVEFRADDFNAVHYGIIWQEFKEQYPNIKQTTPILNLDLKSLNQNILFPRLWFISEKEDFLIQLQKDRFLLNWRHLSGEKQYPRFSTLEPRFLTEWSKFISVAKKAEPRLSLIPEKLELAYINHIDQSQGWENEVDTARFFKQFKPFDIAKNVNSAYNIEFEHKTVNIRLNLKTGIRPDNKEKLLVMELKANRTIQTGDSVETWYKNAHNSITDVFLNMITPEAEKAWS